MGGARVGCVRPTASGPKATGCGVQSARAYECRVCTTTLVGADGAEAHCKRHALQSVAACACSRSPQIADRSKPNTLATSNASCCAGVTMRCAKPIVTKLTISSTTSTRKADMGDQSFILRDGYHSAPEPQSSIGSQARRAACSTEKHPRQAMTGMSEITRMFSGPYRSNSIGNQSCRKR